MMMISFKLLLIASTVQLLNCCFCPPPITPSCGCSSNSYASSPSLQPQTIFYSNPIPVPGPVSPTYGQPPPIYVQSSYYPVGSQYPLLPGYANIPQNPAVVQNPISPYQPRTPIINPYKQTTVFSPDPVIPPAVKQVNVLPSQPEAPFISRVVEDQTHVYPPSQQVRKPSIPDDFETEDDFEIIGPARTTPRTVIATSTFSSIPRTVAVIPSSTVDEVEELEITDTTTNVPHEATTRIVPIPRKEGDGKSDDYEYFYIYYDDDKNQTSIDKNKKTAGAAHGKVAEKSDVFEDFDDNTHDVAKETSVLDAGKVELDGADYNVLEVNAIRRNIKTNYINKTSKKNSYDVTSEEYAPKTTTSSPYPNDDYEEYEVEEFVPVNPDGSEGEPQILKISPRTQAPSQRVEIAPTDFSPEVHDQGVYKRANNFHGISKHTRTKLVDETTEPSPSSGKEMSSRKILRANRRKLNDGEVRRHPKP